MLPVRIGILAVTLYFLFSSDWFNQTPNTQTVFLQTLRGFSLAYILCNVIAAAIFFSWERFPPGLFQWLAFVLGLLDGLFVAGLVMITDGFDSMAFWIFPILIVINAISIPFAMPQIVLNLLFSVFYIGASFLYPDVGPQIVQIMSVPGPRTPHIQAETNTVAGQAHVPTSHHPVRLPPPSPPPEEYTLPTESLLLHVFVLMLLTFCCYGIQTLAERQRRELEEAREFAVREGQLHSAGRLAAEFAHQIKNPLAVITNAAFSLQRSLSENKDSAAQQIEIIQEEVARADRVITQIMGYAELSEGRVEKILMSSQNSSALLRRFSRPPSPVKSKSNANSQTISRRCSCSEIICPKFLSTF